MTVDFDLEGRAIQESGVRVVGRRSLEALLEHRVLLELLLDQVDQLHARQLQQLDRLLELRRHHQLLRELQLLLEPECHFSLNPT